MSGATQADPGAAITAVVVVYGAPAARLQRCVEALRTAGGSGLDVVLVDNRSPAEPGAATAVAALTGARVVLNPSNLGFSEAVNRAVMSSAPGRDLVLLVNDDALVAPEAIVHLADALRSAAPEVVGVAPKMVLAAHPGVIDAVGICVNDRGEGINVGLGQPDLGQFDRPGPCFGVCFGAALLRRSAFADDAVGPLWSASFLYYEDVEWCWRARLLGFGFMTAPDAVVHHEMSASSRADGYDLKHRWIERNLLLCALRCAEPRRALAIWAWRLPRLAMRVARCDRAGSSGRAALAAIASIPRELVARWRVQRRRVVGDAAIISFSAGERIFFDPVTYEPTDREAARRAAEARLARIERG
jgi:hypothetical protein